MTATRQALGLVGWVALSFCAGLVGGFFKPDAWYVALSKPSWNPPGWVFAPVWTALYALMGLAAWFVWRARGWSGAGTALALFVGQLVLNAMWTWLFFGLHRPDLALLEIALLWLVILATLLAFWRVRPLAGALLAPYLAWVGFAIVLNAAIWRKNP